LFFPSANLCAHAQLPRNTSYRKSGLVVGDKTDDDRAVQLAQNSDAVVSSVSCLFKKKLFS
jgi:hypothetical protein